MNVKGSYTKSNCPCPSTSKDMPDYNWYKWALLISKKHEQGRQASPRSQESKRMVWSCRKCSFPIHLAPSRYHAGGPRYGSKQSTRDSCTQELWPVEFLEPDCMTDTAPGERWTVTKTPTKPSSPVLPGEIQTAERISFYRQSDHTKTNN